MTRLLETETAAGVSTPSASSQPPNPSSSIQAPTPDLMSSVEEGEDGRAALTADYYTPSGKWNKMAGQIIEDVVLGPLIGRGAMASAFFATGWAVRNSGSRVPIDFICKRWDIWSPWDGFHSEMFLFASPKHLRPLQGICVPAIISVQNMDGGFITVNMEPPSHTSWVQAHPKFTSLSDKLRIIRAYEKIHAQGVLHGDVELRHMLISAGGRVCIIDFQMSRALSPNAAAGLEVCSPHEIALEMRRVKFLLEFNDAVQEECDRWYSTESGNRNSWVRYAKIRQNRTEADWHVAANELPDEFWDNQRKVLKMWDTRNSWFEQEALITAEPIPLYQFKFKLPPNPELIQRLAQKKLIRAAAVASLSSSPESSRSPTPTGLLSQEVSPLPSPAQTVPEPSPPPEVDDKTRSESPAQNLSQLSDEPVDNAIASGLHHTRGQNATLDAKLKHLELLKEGLRAQQAEMQYVERAQRFYTQLTGGVEAQPDGHDVEWMLRKRSEFEESVDERVVDDSLSLDADEDALSPSSPARAAHPTAPIPPSSRRRSDAPSPSPRRQHFPLPKLSASHHTISRRTGHARPALSRTSSASTSHRRKRQVDRLAKSPGLAALADAAEASSILPSPSHTPPFSPPRHSLRLFEVPHDGPLRPARRRRPESADSIRLRTKVERLMSAKEVAESDNAPDYLRNLDALLEACGDEPYDPVKEAEAVERERKRKAREGMDVDDEGQWSDTDSNSSTECLARGSSNVKIDPLPSQVSAGSNFEADADALLADIGDSISRDHSAGVTIPASPAKVKTPEEVRMRLTAALRRRRPSTSLPASPALPKRVPSIDLMPSPDRILKRRAEEVPTQPQDGDVAEARPTKRARSLSPASIRVKDAQPLPGGTAPLF